MAITKFETNKPREIALKYKSGKPAKSSFDGSQQTQFVLTDGSVMYVPASVGDDIAALNLAPQEPFLLTKLPQGAWNIERKPMAKAAELIGETLPVNGKGESALRIALRTVIDEAAEAEQYAAKKGLNIRFDNGDLRAFVNTMMIGMQYAGGR